MIREARPGDADQIAEAHVEGWRVGYRGLVPDSFLDSTLFADARRDGWGLILSGQLPDALGGGDRVFVPVVGGRVVGFGHVGFERDGAGSGELHGFYIHPGFWGTGVAGVLIERCHAALEQICCWAILWVLRDNHRARRFYERHGWSCGEDEHLVEAAWPGPQMNGVPRLEQPLPEVQYRRRFAAAGP